MTNSHYRDPVTGRIYPEKRKNGERRVPQRFFSIFVNPFRRRRSKGRRKTDRGSYVDVYDSRTWFIAIAVLILSGIDAVMTALHMTGGTAAELNPIMAAIIQHGGLPAFFGAKAVMTVFPMAVIVVHKEWPLGKFAARTCLWAYALLSLYHLYLIILLS
jgi:hypothetical protein